MEKSIWPEEEGGGDADGMMFHICIIAFEKLFSAIPFEGDKSAKTRD
jgi:hypothetical protein